MTCRCYNTISDHRSRTSMPSAVFISQPQFPHRAIGIFFRGEVGKHSAGREGRIHTDRDYYKAETFLFIPAYRAGGSNEGEIAPFGRWRIQRYKVLNAWSNSAWVPNSHGIALLELKEQNMHWIGDVTGYLGNWRGRVVNNNLTMLGYHVNLDGGGRMQVNNAGMFKKGMNNTYLYGSVMGQWCKGWPMDRGFWRSSSDRIV